MCTNDFFMVSFSERILETEMCVKLSALAVKTFGKWCGQPSFNSLGPAEIWLHGHCTLDDTHKRESVTSWNSM